jgi:enoyl-CoA hydratase/carnithine racemase
MILTTDIRIAVADARIGFVFAKRGITPEACSSFFLPRIVGPSKAAEWVYTGRIFKAGDEVNSGLFNYILPTKEAALQKAQEIALEISHNSSAVSVAISKKLFQSSFFYQPANPEDAHRLESRCIAYCGSKGDAIEGVMSFLEKRPPQFTLKVSQDMPPESWFPKVDIQPKSKL